MQVTKYYCDICKAEITTSLDSFHTFKRDYCKTCFDEHIMKPAIKGGVEAVKKSASSWKEWIMQKVNYYCDSCEAFIKSDFYEHVEDQGEPWDNWDFLCNECEFYIRPKLANSTSSDKAW
jgi:hypothetical protein